MNDQDIIYELVKQTVSLRRRLRNARAVYNKTRTRADELSDAVDQANMREYGATKRVDDACARLLREFDIPANSFSNTDAFQIEGAITKATNKFREAAQEAKDAKTFIVGATRRLIEEFGIQNHQQLGLLEVVEACVRKAKQPNEELQRVTRQLESLQSRAADMCGALEALPSIADANVQRAYVSLALELKRPVKYAVVDVGC
jgi:hypothetical protein